MNEWIAFTLGALALWTPSSPGHGDLGTTEDAVPAPITARQSLEDTSEPVLPLATDGSGEVLRELGRQDAARAGSTKLRPGALGVLDPATGKVQQVRNADQSKPGTQTVFGALNSDHAVWTEQTSTKISESDWTIRAFDRATGDTTTVAKATPIDEAGTMPTVPGFTVPTLDRDTVYWSQADPSPHDPTNPPVNVYAGDADGSGEPELVARDAIMPRATDGWLYYVGFDGSSPKADGYTVHRQSLETGEREIVTERPTGSVTELVADGDTVALGTGGDTIEVFTDGEHVTSVEGKDEALGRMSLTDGILGFSDNSKQTGQNYVLDIHAERLFRLDAAPGLAHVLVTGSEGDSPGVAWALGSEAQDWQYGRLDIDADTDSAAE